MEMAGKARVTSDSDCMSAVCALYLPPATCHLLFLFSLGDGEGLRLVKIKIIPGDKAGRDLSGDEGAEGLAAVAQLAVGILRPEKRQAQLVQVPGELLAVSLPPGGRLKTFVSVATGALTQKTR